MILLEGGVNKNGFIPVNFFAYATFRKRFMKILLDLLDKEINTKEFRKLKKEFYRRYIDGFYVYSPPSKFKNLDGLIKYVTRYVSRPVMLNLELLIMMGHMLHFGIKDTKMTKLLLKEFIHTSLLLDLFYIYQIKTLMMISLYLVMIKVLLL